MAVGGCSSPPRGTPMSAPAAPRRGGSDVRAGRLTDRQPRHRAPRGGPPLCPLTGPHVTRLGEEADEDEDDGAEEASETTRAVLQSVPSPRRPRGGAVSFSTRGALDPRRGEALPTRRA
eukprot:scaffold5681_cov377-Prasinococcus_capsulatus_cf.AAC.1